MIVLLIGCGTEKQPVGAKCSANDECASNQCGGTVDCGRGTCHCAHDEDCPDGQTCELTTDCGRACMSPTPAP